MSGQPPSYAQPLAPDPGDPNGTANQVRALYARPAASAVYLVDLSPNDDDGPARSWVQTKPKVTVRTSGRGAYVRAVATPSWCSR
ncbi:hypothetical protein GCM10020254_70460 [Streptomyces goshikiensis]